MERHLKVKRHYNDDMAKKIAQQEEDLCAYRAVVNRLIQQVPHTCQNCSKKECKKDSCNWHWNGWGNLKKVLNNKNTK